MQLCQTEFKNMYIMLIQTTGVPTIKAIFQAAPKAKISRKRSTRRYLCEVLREKCKPRIWSISTTHVSDTWERYASQRRAQSHFRGIQWNGKKSLRSI